MMMMIIIITTIMMMNRWCSTIWKRTPGGSSPRSWKLEDTPFLPYLFQGDGGIAHDDYDDDDDVDSGDDDGDGDEDSDEDEDVVDVNIWLYDAILIRRQLFCPSSKLG